MFYKIKKKNVGIIIFMKLLVLILMIKEIFILEIGKLVMGSSLLIKLHVWIGSCKSLSFENVFGNYLLRNFADRSSGKVTAQANIKANQYFYKALQTARATQGQLEWRSYFQHILENYI